MLPTDDSTVPVKTLPTFVQASSLHPLSVRLVQEATVRNPGQLIDKNAPLAPAEQTAAGVSDLTALFADSLTDTEAAFALAKHKATLVQPTGAAPKNFLQAHMIIIDQLLMDPSISTTRLASVTGYSRNWLHKVMSSDAFQAKLAERQKNLCDPIVMDAIKDRLNGITSRALEILEERLDNDKVSLDHALSVLGMSTKALGLGQQKQAAGPTANFIIHVPAQMPSASDWAAQHGGTTKILSEPIDITPAPLADQSPSPEPSEP